MRIMPFFASLFMSNLSKVAHKIVADRIPSHKCGQPPNFVSERKQRLGGN